jgi:hypothetical protein
MNREAGRIVAAIRRMREADYRAALTKTEEDRNRAIELHSALVARILTVLNQAGAA